MGSEVPIAVSIVFSAQPRQVRECNLLLAAGTTVGQALAESGILVGPDAAQVAELECGVWGRKVPLSHVLRDADRIELYRPLVVDPKEARRLRFAGQGAKTAGLFQKKRRGAKAGY